MTERCYCGDTATCPDCGLANGTYPRQDIEREIADNINETLRGMFGPTLRFDRQTRTLNELNRDGGDTRAAMALSRVAIDTDRDWEKEQIKREFRK